MRPGSSRDWRMVLKEKTSEDLSARAMVTYFQPLMAYLQQQNKGRKSRCSARFAKLISSEKSEKSKRCVMLSEVEASLPHQ